MANNVVSVKSNIHAVRKQFEELSEKDSHAATVQGLNAAANETRKVASRNVASELRMLHATVRKRFPAPKGKKFRFRNRWQKATRRKLETVVKIFTQPIPWRSLDAKATAKGVRAKKGRYEAGAWLNPSLGMHAFKRRGKARLPIDKLVVQMKEPLERATDAAARNEGAKRFVVVYENAMKKKIKRRERSKNASRPL